MATKVVLVNFNVPVTLKAEFDEVCSRRNLSRTGVLIGFIEQFVEQDAEKRRRKIRRSEMVEPDDTPPSLVFSTVEDDGAW